MHRKPEASRGRASRAHVAVKATARRKQRESYLPEVVRKRHKHYPCCGSCPGGR